NGHELAGLRDVPDDPEIRRHAQLRQLGQGRDARADLAGRRVDQPPGRAGGAERACDAVGERGEHVVELYFARDHRPEIGQQLEALLVLAHDMQHRTVHAAAAFSASRALSTRPSRAATVPGSAARAAASIAVTPSSVRPGSWWN